MDQEIVVEKRRWKRQIICFILATLFFAAALILAFENFRAGESAEQNTAALTAALKTEMGAVPDIPENYPEEVVPNWVLDPDRDMPVLDIDGIACIGTVSFPARDLSFPVASEWSYEDLNKAACRYWGSIYKDNAVIFAHNYKGQFDFLPELAPGETVVFTDIEGNEFRYEMAAGATLWPRQVKEMISKDDLDWDLTLFTCTTWGEARVTARLIRIDPEK